MSSGDRLYFVHYVPRRTRLKVPQRRGDDAFFADLERRLSALSGVQRLTVAPDNASVVVHHTPDFRWSTVRFEAMGLRPVAHAFHDARRTGASARYSGSGPAEVNLASAILWVVKAICSGQVLARALELVAATLIQYAIDDLLKADTAQI